MTRVLLTSVCRPLGERHGDSPSVGYELLFGQVTRNQGLFSPRANHVAFSLEYVAENVEAPTTVLHYPSRKELVRELAKGYDVVGVSFVLSTFHRMKEVVALVREHAPGAKVVLGGYGTVLPDAVLAPYSDHVCREEGVGFMRRLLGEPAGGGPGTFRHPLVVSRLKVFSREASRTGMVFAGLGCPNGCDFCCTSHFFKRRHVALLPTGRDIYGVVERYLEIEPEMSIAILDEDFLLNRRRAMEFRECVKEGGRALSIFAFASVKAISQYTVEEILEMGIDGLWIGYEGTRSGYAKQEGRPVDELFRDLREHGISVLSSMIVGLPYQTPEVIDEELSGLLALRPTLAQFMIYGPIPGTPFYEQVVREGRLAEEMKADPERFWKSSTGFRSMVKHPAMSGKEIEDAQERCFEEDYRRLGPSIYRSLETWILGHERLKGSENPSLREKAARFAREVRKAYPIFLAGRTLAPGREMRRRIAELQARVHASLGRPTVAERIASVAGLAMAAWTGLTLKLGFFQHPSLIRHRFRMPEESLPAKAWRRLASRLAEGHSVEVELRSESTVWVRVAGRLNAAGAEELAAGLREGLRKRKERLVLDLERLGHIEQEALDGLAERLRAYQGRVRVVLPQAGEFAAIAAVFAIYR